MVVAGQPMSKARKTVRIHLPWERESIQAWLLHYLPMQQRLSCSDQWPSFVLMTCQTQGIQHKRTDINNRTT